MGREIKREVGVCYYLIFSARNADKVTYGKRLESKFIQTDEFAVAAVKNSELLRTAKVPNFVIEKYKHHIFDKKNYSLRPTPSYLAVIYFVLDDVCFGTKKRLLFSSSHAHSQGGR